MLSEIEIKIVRELQNDLPLVSRPFKEVADRLGISERELLDKIKEFIDRGIIRRFGATIRHQDVGFVANAMVVWDVPEERISETGRLMAEFPEVTHCYQRACHAGWNYPLFTVLHGRSPEECVRITEKIASATGIKNYRLLFSTRELKKSSMKYFMD